MTHFYSDSYSDISKQKRREEQFRSLVQEVKEYAIFMLDPKGRVTTWNAGAERIKGYAEDEILGTHFSAFYPEDARRAGTPEEALKVATREGQWTDEGWRIRKDGSRFWALVTLTAVHGEDGTLHGFVKVTRDLTERKTLVRELERERNFIGRVLETVGAIVVVVDMEGRVVRANRKFEEVSGYTREEFEDENVFERLIPLEDQEGVREVMEKHRRGQEHTFHENHWITKEGKRRLIRWSSTAFRNEEGEVTHVIGTGLDITERRDLERKVVTATDEERRRIGLKLHDRLASQLAGATMMARSLASQLKDENPEAARRAERVAELVRESSEQTRDLSHALMPLEIRSEELADGLEQLARRQEERSGIPCSFAAGAPIPELPGEVASHLYHIASEATANAIEHAGPDAIRLRMGVEDEHLVLAVHDDGTGLPGTEGEPGERNRQVGAGETHGHGLDIMRYRANLIGARLEIDSNEEGTTVRCRLPLKHIPESE